MGNMCVSSRKSCVLVSVVYPVEILSVVFFVICSLLMFVPGASGDHMVEMCSSIGLVMALHVTSIISFCFSHVVDVSVLSICIDLLSMCLLLLFALGLGSSQSRFKQHRTHVSLVISTCTIRHGTQDRPIQEGKECTTQSTDLTMVLYSTGVAPREFRQTQSRVRQMSH